MCLFLPASISSFPSFRSLFAPFTSQLFIPTHLVIPGSSSREGDRAARKQHLLRSKITQVKTCVSNPSLPINTNMAPISLSSRISTLLLNSYSRDLSQHQSDPCVKLHQAVIWDHYAETLTGTLPPYQIPASASSLSCSFRFACSICSMFVFSSSALWSPSPEYSTTSHSTFTRPSSDC